MKRLTRLDIILVAAFFATTFLLAVIHPPSAKVRKNQPRASATAVQRSEKEDLKFPFPFKIQEKEIEQKIKNNPVLAARYRMVSFFFTLVSIGSLFCLGHLVYCFFTGKRFYQPLGSPPPPNWGLREIVRLVLLVLVVAQTAIILEMLAARVWRPAWMDRNVLALLNTVLMDVSAALGVWWFLRKVSSQAVPLRRWKTVSFAISCYLVFLPGFFILTAAVVSFMQKVNIEPAPQAAVTMFLSENRASVIWWLMLLATVGGPIAEELFFRGLLYRYLRVRLGVVMGLAVSALLFSALHANLLALVPVFALGLLLGWVYEKTGTLLAPMSIHIAHNASMLTLASVVKDLLA